MRTPGVARLVTLVLLAGLVPWRGAAGQDSIAAPSTFTLTGQIVDALNEQPVISAVVKLPELQRFVFSDVNGRFAVPEFPVGTWEIVVEMLGYHTLEGSFTVAEGNGLVLRLTPDPVALEGLRVQSRADGLLERRRRRHPYRVDHISPQDIANAINPDPVVIFSRNTRVSLRPCYWGPTDMEFGCYDRRGRVKGVRVLLDEAPLLGGMPELQMFPADHIHSMDWVPASAELHVYTRFFIERLNDSRMRLMPFDPYE
ncbi:MAG: carboxypeptidase-like regulatory domain-containing protein [Gemmatimonadota bacterium]|nr:carboxypeptidase-like regulatory domain-containing protein [Gemmatimonadota bacterium]